MTFASGILEATPLPWPYLITASGLMFMALSVGVHYLLKLLFARNPEGKFSVGQLTFGKVYENNKVAWLKYNFLHGNRANFPIEFEVRPIRVTLGASVNPNPVRPRAGSIVPPMAGGIFSEAAIPVLSSMAGCLIEGDFEFEVHYGRPGKLRYVYRKKYKIYAKFKPDGDLENVEPNELE